MNVLLLAAATVGAVSTQARVDQLIGRCGAEHVVQLVARSRTAVIIDMQIVARPPSPEENQKFECVLRGMKLMKDLQFGFIGNVAPDR